MYFVERSKIVKTLNYIDEMLAHIDSNSMDTTIEKIALERIIHVIIEGIIDVGSMMIDGFIMRDPGSYEDIVDILVDEKVIPETDQELYTTFIKQRDMLVRDYLDIDHELLHNTVIKSKKTLEQFSVHVKSYLKAELGVAHAFSNET